MYIGSNVFSKILLFDVELAVLELLNKLTSCRTTKDYAAYRISNFLLAVGRRRLSWFGRVCRHDSLPKIILQGTAIDDSRRNIGNCPFSDVVPFIANHCRRCCASQTTEVDGQP